MKGQNNPVVAELEKKQVGKNVLLLENPNKIPEEISETLETLKDFGIENSTKTLIQEKVSAKEEEDIKIKRENAKNSMLALLSDKLSPFKIVEYKTIDDLAKEYDLIIVGLGNYQKPIPDENIEELKAFKEAFVSLYNSLDKYEELDEDDYNSYELYLEAIESLRSRRERRMKEFNSQIRFINNNSFSFEERPILYNGIGTVDFKTCFNIMAPKSHIKLPDNHLRIGNEIKVPTKEKPKLKNSIKVELNTQTISDNINSFKSSFEDPVIFLPFRFMEKVYCIVVTAWDKVGDDSRIRQML